MVRVRAPELPPDYDWLNTAQPLSLKQLRGRVVLLDFWTYCCINCLHILPDLHYLEQKYKDCLTVIGVHSAKFDNEKEVENIRQAILRYNIEHPVVVDRGFHLWQHYTVRAWPTVVVIDPEGYVVGAVSGEGKRDFLDELITKLIEEHKGKGTINVQELNQRLEKENAAIHPLAFPGKILADQETDLLFIADTGHHRIVITTLAGEVKQVIGNGAANLWDGDFEEAQFASPQGMAFDREHQCLYVADTDNHSIRKVDLQRQTVETIAGIGHQSRNLRPHQGDAHETALNSPWDVVISGHFLLIAMAGSHQIWALNLVDDALGTLIGTGAEACVDGSTEIAAFAQPSGLASDGKELFVADSEGSTIRAVTLDKTPQVRTVCGSGDLFGFGDRDGQGEEVRLQHCMDVEYGDSSQLWIADTYNHKIKRVDLETGICQTLLGNGEPALRDGQGLAASFYEPSGLSMAGDWLFIADTNNHAIRRVNLKTLTVSTLEIPGLCAPQACFDLT
ncbi:MAG: thioredoxin-like domain-containing protein [Leptolyngbya sp. IPPAS B-1204]